MEQDLGISESLAIKSLISHFNSLWLLEIESRTMYWLGFNARDTGSGRSHGGINGNSLQYSYLGNPMNREAC